MTLDRVELVRWAGVLALEVGREVDLGIVDSTNLVWTGDPGLTRRRGAELLSLYLKIQEDRKEVLDAYRA